jgi:hypothetical protein
VPGTLGGKRIVDAAGHTGINRNYHFDSSEGEMPLAFDRNAKST